VVFNSLKSLNLTNVYPNHNNNNNNNKNNNKVKSKLLELYELAGKNSKNVVPVVLQLVRIGSLKLV
jgi:hypothetical protein